jgi:hypothetical protein
VYYEHMMKREPTGREYTSLFLILLAAGSSSAYSKHSIVKREGTLTLQSRTMPDLQM